MNNTKLPVKIKITSKTNSYKRLIVCCYLLMLCFISPMLNAQPRSFIQAGMYKDLRENAQMSKIEMGILASQNQFHVGLQLLALKYWQCDYSSLGLGLQPVAGITVFEAKKWQLGFIARGGLVIMFPEYRETSLNFTFSAAFMLTWQLSKKNKLFLTTGYEHFSNGKPMDNLTNPMWDGIGLSAGLLFDFKSKEKNK